MIIVSRIKKSLKITEVKHEVNEQVKNNYRKKEQNGNNKKSINGNKNDSMQHDKDGQCVVPIASHKNHKH